LASGPPISFATPVNASLDPSITPRAAAEECSTVVRKLGSSALAISCPESEKKLTALAPATPGLSHSLPTADFPAAFASDPATSRSPAKVTLDAVRH
jgi:hypothetical protein